ncbi:MAG TPA: hypothetical protein PLF78_00980 [Caulobacter sp.]|nr:hypothetical protein [Caulobacter sp.]
MTPCGRVLSANLAGVLVLGLAACASTGDQSAPKTSSGMGEAVGQPLRDLGMVRPATPDVLVNAAAAPYAVADSADCAALAEEVAALDILLGQDVDAPKSGDDNLAGDIVLGALRGAVSLPFRGVVRRVSGAERRDRERAAAILAGMVRRGYLKGLLAGARCPAGGPG